jgi:hypothetical protein
MKPERDLKRTINALRSARATGQAAASIGMYETIQVSLIGNKVDF